MHAFHIVLFTFHRKKFSSRTRGASAACVQSASNHCNVGVRRAIIMLHACHAVAMALLSPELEIDSPPPLACMLQTKLFVGIEVHDRHPAKDLGNRLGLSATGCAEWCCSRDDCKCWFHTSNQTRDARDCRAGQPCCWLKPTFNSSRVHDDRDCQGQHQCVSGVRMST